MVFFFLRMPFVGKFPSHTGARPSSRRITLPPPRRALCPSHFYFSPKGRRQGGRSETEIAPFPGPHPTRLTEFPVAFGALAQKQRLKLAKGVVRLVTPTRS